MGTKGLTFFLDKIILNNTHHQSIFLKRLLINWNDIVGDEKLSKYSIPAKISIESNKSILTIYTYSGSVSVYLQGMINKIEQNIKLNLGYLPVNEIRIIQKI